MKESGSERVQQIIQKDMQRLIDKIHKDSKGIKPFGQPELDPLEELYHIENSGYLQDPNQTLMELGYKGTIKLFERYSELKERYNA